MYQKTTIIGRLGRDPELRYTPQGTAICSFSVATDKGWGDKKTTVWFRVSAWEKLAEVCNQYLKKGRLVFIEGQIEEPKPWEAKDGTWKASLELTAREVKFLGGREDAVSKPEESTPQETKEDFYEDSTQIPF